MKCSKCSTENPWNAKFCIQCGNKLNAESYPVDLLLVNGDETQDCRIIKVNNVEFRFIRVLGAKDKFGYDYYIMDAPITNYQILNSFVEDIEFRNIVIEHYSKYSRYGAENNFKRLLNERLNFPFEIATWEFTIDFMERLNRKISTINFYLPSKLEWEYAAIGGVKTKGYTYSGSNNVGEVAWYKENSHGELHNVKEKAPNELGIYDMSGLVREWTQDIGDSNLEYSVANGHYRQHESWCVTDCFSGQRIDDHFVDGLGFRIVIK